MPVKTIPDAVRRLIIEWIDSVPELEALLLLREHRTQGWSPEAAGARLYVSTAVAARVFATLTERGFFAFDNGCYRYAPESKELEVTVDQLSETYATQLIAITNMIHGKPNASVREFADAFRLRKDK